MAYGLIPEPGSEVGPCENEDCGHTDCAEMREMARTRCPHCDEPIGYEAKYTMDDVLGIEHWLCALEEAEK